jgi:oxygen-independent coproporphyrinogen III oxidase
MGSASALYLHVPFCSRICPYCAFNVTSRFDPAVLDRFIEASTDELSALDLGRPLRLKTIYVGGGTPTELDPDRLGRLLRAISSRCDPAAVVEWTVEANPDGLSPEKASVLKASGVSRVSLGAQSLQERLLKRLGRTHTAGDVRTAVATLREAGFERINVDLIYAQPEQTLEAWVRDLDAVLELGITHLSLYELTFEPTTPFGRGHARGAIPRADDALAVAMFSTARERLAEAGLEWYEVSNFAVPGHESEHNRVYWRNEPYFGVGPGAFGCLDDVRTMNASDVLEWERLVASTGSGVFEREALTSANTFVETLASGLRTREGVDLEVLRRRTGFDVTRTHAAAIASLRERGLAEVTPDRLRLTLAGVLVLDSILLDFLDAP